MEVIDKVTAPIPKSLVFTKKEVDIILELLYIKKRHSVLKEREITEELIKGFESLKRNFDQEERWKAGLW